MKRRLTQIALFLILGAIVNVAVAWGCACWSPMTWAELAIGEELPWPLPVPDDWPPVPTWIGRDRSFGLDEFSAHANSELLTVRAGSQWVLCAGWPLHALAIERHRAAPHKFGRHFGLWMQYESQGDWLDGLAIPRWIPWSERGSVYISGLPTYPVWPGFAINTVFYAFIVWLVFAAPFALRRRRRIKRGLCSKCGYDLRGVRSVACPECGPPK